MIDFSPPPHVQTTVNAIHRFIADELEPIQRVNIAKALGL